MNNKNTLIKRLASRTSRFVQITRKLIFTASALLLLSVPASAAKILRYSDHEPLGGMRTRFIKDVFFHAIEKESRGRLIVEDHWNSEIAVGYEALKAVGEKNTADMAIVVPEYVANDLPLHQIFKSFPVGPTGNNQVEFFRRIYAQIPAFPAELEKANAVNLLFTTGYPVAFFSTNPLETLEDIKGEKWRSASFWHKDFLSNAGAEPITMPWGKGVFEALQARTLDGLMVNVDSGYMLKVHEVAPNVLVSKDLWLGHVYLLVMNKKTWDGLAKRDKQAIQRAAKTAYKTLGSVMDSSFDAQLKELEAAGAKTRILSPREVEHWQTVTNYRQVQAAWIKEQEDKGLKNVGPVVEKVTALMDDAMKQQPGAASPR